MGGLDRVARVVKRIRADRPEALLLDGGDTWQGSLDRAADERPGHGRRHERARARRDDLALGVHARHRPRAARSSTRLPFPFLGANIFDAEWDEPAFDGGQLFRARRREGRRHRPGLPLPADRQSGLDVPQTSPSASARSGCRSSSTKPAAKAPALVVLLSHNGFDVDRKMASRVRGLDVILTGHTHDALPEPVQRRQDAARRLGLERQVREPA